MTELLEEKLQSNLEMTEEQPSERAEETEALKDSRNTKKTLLQRIFSLHPNSKLTDMNEIKGLGKFNEKYQSLFTNDNELKRKGFMQIAIDRIRDIDNVKETFRCRFKIDFRYIPTYYEFLSMIVLCFFFTAHFISDCTLCVFFVFFLFF